MEPIQLAWASVGLGIIHYVNSPRTFALQFIGYGLRRRPPQAVLTVTSLGTCRGSVAFGRLKSASQHATINLGSLVQLAGTEIIDTFAEGFRMVYTRLEITALDDYWLDQALRSFCGYGTSVIACDAEVGVERYLTKSETVDGRCGAHVLLFGFSAERLGETVPRRVGQCVMTCPTTSVFNGLSEGDAGEIELGRHLRYFGDGYQLSKLLEGRRFWRIPVMDGEFVAEQSARVAKGVAGGNFMIEGVDQEAALTSARRAIAAIASLPGVITPFPGGVVRSGSKVGSKYAGLKASTNHAFCPTLRGQVATEIVADAACVYEIVIDGVDEAAVAEAMRVGIEAAAGEGIPAISAGNYGGKLGKFHFHLRRILAAPANGE